MGSITSNPYFADAAFIFGFIALIFAWNAVIED
jgi:hypothetical protein